MTRATAFDRDHVGAQSRIGHDEIADQVGRGDHQAVIAQADKTLGDCDLVVEPAGQLEVAIDPEPAAGAVLAVLVEDQLVARHDVAHAVGHRSGHIAVVGARAVLRPAPFVLRPQAVQHEGIAPPAAGLALGIKAAVADVGAVGWAPGQRQHVVLEATGRGAIGALIAGALAVGHTLGLSQAWGGAGRQHDHRQHQDHDGAATPPGCGPAPRRPSGCHRRHLHWRTGSYRRSAGTSPERPMCAGGPRRIKRARDLGRFYAASRSRMRAQLRAPLRNEDRLYFSLGEWMRSSSRPKPTNRLSMPSSALNAVTIGIEPPMPISAAGRPHSSFRASAARAMNGASALKAMAGEPCPLRNSARQSLGRRSRTKVSMPRLICWGSCPGTSRQVIFTEARAGMTVLVPTPW